MADFTGSFGDVLTRELQSLTGTTPIRQTVAGGKARAILEANAREIENLSRLSSDDFKKAFLPTTSGKYLDHWGATVGLQKYPQRNAEVTVADRAIKVRTRFGTNFGSINGGNGFTITAGTRMTAPAIQRFEDTRGLDDITVADTRRDRSIHYSTTHDVYCAADAFEAWLPAKASTPGVLGNLAAPGMINSHNFTGYTDSIGKTLLITNVKPILNGTDIETEASYRYRISKQITAAEKANNVAITLASLSVPGVADIVIVPFEDGAGRFNVYIKAVSPTVPDRLLVAVQESINRVVAVGNVGYARRPYEVGIELDTTLIYRPSLKEDEKNEIRSVMRTAATSYINSLDLGQPLVLSELSNTLRNLDSRVVAVGSNRTTLFDALFGWYPARMLEGGKRREKLISGTIQVPPHARIIVESSLSDPLRFI